VFQIGGESVADISKVLDAFQGAGAVHSGKKKKQRRSRKEYQKKRKAEKKRLKKRVHHQPQVPLSVSVTGTFRVCFRVQTFNSVDYYSTQLILTQLLLCFYHQAKVKNKV
jgi:hypothetical protein